MKKIISILLLSALALSAISACALHADETPQNSDESIYITINTVIDSNILDSCKEIKIYNFAEVKISDKETLSSICNAVRSAKLEEAPAHELPKGAIKAQFLGGSGNQTLFLSDDLIFVDDKVYKDSSKAFIGEIKACSDKYIMDSCILDSCDKIVINGYSYTSTVTDKSEIAEICDAIKETDFTLTDIGYPVTRDGGIYVEFFGGGISQGFQPGEIIYINNMGFRANSTDFCDIIEKYNLKYKEEG